MTGKQLSLLLEDKGIKQKWIANKLKVSTGLVSQWVNGITDIDKKYVIELKNILR